MCDGDRQLGPDQVREEMELQSQLERCGWNFVRIKAGVFYRDPEKGLEQLWSLLNKPKGFQAKDEQSSDLDTFSSTMLDTPGSIYNFQQWSTDRASAQ